MVSKYPMLSVLPGSLSARGLPYHFNVVVTAKHAADYCNFNQVN